MDLWWQEDEDGSHIVLYCGVLDIELVTLTKAKKWWGGFIWLTGVAFDREYGPLDAMKAEAETKVQHWFGLANTSRPAVDSDSDA